MLSKIPFVAVFIENRFLKFVHLKAKAGGSAADFRKQKISEVRKIGENLAVGSEYKCYALRVARAETRLTVYRPLQVYDNWTRGSKMLKIWAPKFVLKMPTACARPWSTSWRSPNFDSILWQKVIVGPNFLHVAKTRVFEKSDCFSAKCAQFLFFWKN